MAVKISRATGNWLTAGTWGTVDSTSYNNTETTTTALTTSYQTSSTFTPGAITVDGFALKLSVRTGTTGTMTVALDQGGSDVAGTEVIINTADLPVAATADLNGGWIFFEFAAPVTLLAVTAYGVKAKTSSSSQVSLFSTATTNWARALSTTTTGAPGAGDDVIICGEYTGAGTSNSFTVTMDETATTDYGAASTSLVTPAIAICSKGTLSYGTTAATAYNLKVSGNIVVYTGGTFNMGSSGAEIPRDSSAVLTFDCGANVDFGLTVRNLGTFNTAGLSRTSGKNIYYCKLNTDEAVNSTSLGVDTDTGWLDNDEIAVASTTRTASQSEAGTLNGAAGASSLTVDGFAGVGGGLAFAHDGTSPVQAEVILLTRNVRIQGASASLQSYVDIKATATLSCIWTEFKWLGSGTSNKRGIEVATSTGTASLTYCAFRNFAVSNSTGVRFTNASSTGYTFSNNVTWAINSDHVYNTTITSTSWTMDGNVFISNTGGSTIVYLTDVGGTFTNNILVGACGVAGLYLPDSGQMGTFSDITIHSTSTSAMQFSGAIYGTITNLTIWRASSAGVILQGGEVTISNLVTFGCSGANVLATQGGGKYTFISPVSNGDTTFATSSGLNLGSSSLAMMDITIINGDFSTASGIKTAHSQDINFGVSASGVFYVYLNNTKLGAATEISNQTGMSPSSFVGSEKHDQTAGLHKTWKRYGTITIETTTVHTGGHSVKLTPNNASYKLESPSFYIAVANGATLTPTVYVYEDASYNGARARLILKRNDAIGITSDTVIDTATAASDAAWEALTGTTAAATDDGVMEFVVDCDGTAGNLFVDSFSVA